jgi:hypothetical protein
MLRDTSHVEEIGEHIDYVSVFQHPVDPNCHVLPRLLVDYIQHAVFSAVTCTVFNKVI